eukprot:TRINITY_DN14945_c0_g1_i1.p1 TRINITY_DN14945_c0_g1~~TRINITY_DN14945_c0_g1_i1.p1  ORF type:complete len:661 (-),score=108.76 TRINITY_DN14945_c0_g1_i1:157-2085(-)
MAERSRLNTLRVQELKALCKEEGLGAGGRKVELIERLIEHRHRLLEQDGASGGAPTTSSAVPACGRDEPSVLAQLRAVGAVAATARTLSSAPAPSRATLPAFFGAPRATVSPETAASRAATVVELLEDSPTEPSCSSSASAAASAAVPEPARRVPAARSARHGVAAAAASPGRGAGRGRAGRAGNPFGRGGAARAGRGRGPSIGTEHANNDGGASAATGKAECVGASELVAVRGFQLLCVRCGFLCTVPKNMGVATQQGKFWCPPCRFKEMDPFNAVVEQVNAPGILKCLAGLQGRVEFSIELADLRQWRRDSLGIEVRAIRWNSEKIHHCWPHSLDFIVNGSVAFAVKPPDEGHKRRDVPHSIAANLRLGTNTITLSAVDARLGDFVMAVVLCRPCPIEELRLTLPTCSWETALVRVRDVMAARKAGDDAIAEVTCLTSDKLSLRCPITMERIEDPVRGQHCAHLQCFGLHAYLLSNRQMRAFNNRWACPVCSLVLRPGDLIRDAYVEHVLAATAADAEEVIIAPDGTWRQVVEQPACAAGCNGATAAHASCAGPAVASAKAFAFDIDLDVDVSGASRDHSATGAFASEAATTAGIIQMKSFEEAVFDAPAFRTAKRLRTRLCDEEACGARAIPVAIDLDA